MLESVYKPLFKQKWRFSAYLPICIYRTKLSIVAWQECSSGICSSRDFLSKHRYQLNSLLFLTLYNYIEPVHNLVLFAGRLEWVCQNKNVDLSRTFLPKKKENNRCYSFVEPSGILEDNKKNMINGYSTIENNNFAWTNMFSFFIGIVWLLIGINFAHSL